VIDEALCINFFAGPGTGKSTLSAKLFYEMKVQGKCVEVVPEYAKDLVYGENDVTLKDQLMVLGEQHHRLHRLLNKVDYVINDSSFVVGLIYFEDGKHLTKKMYKDLAVPLFKTYNNLNIFLERNEELEYQEVGRYQDFNGAKQCDVQIKNMLIENDIDFISIKVGNDASENILREIYERKNI